MTTKYDDDNNALTLGDDDELHIGDYEIYYSPNQDEWGVRYAPTGDVSRVPKNRTGSLHPTDFAAAMQGQALADDGNAYSSVQTAVDNASGWVFVGPGTFNENVDITTQGMTVKGAGGDSFINGEDSGNAVLIQAQNVTVSNIGATTDDTTDTAAIRTTSPDSRIFNCDISSNQAGKGVNIAAENATVTHCEIVSSGIALQVNGGSAIVNSNGLESTDTNYGIYVLTDENIIANNVIENTDADGINVDGNDNVVIGNRIIGSDDNGIQTNNDSNENIIANNRISDSTNDDILITGTGNVLDDNKTG